MDMEEQYESETTADDSSVEIPTVEVDKELYQTRLAAATAKWEPIFEQGTEDNKFLHGDQWDDKIMKARESEGLSCLVYNKIMPNYMYVVNNCRRATPSAKITPLSDGADVNTARVYDGLIMDICDRSNADSAYVTALKNALSFSFGYVRVALVYDEQSQRYDIEVHRYPDSTNLFFDPQCKDEDFADARFVFSKEKMAKGEARAEWPDADCFGDPDDKDSETEVEIIEYWERQPAGTWCQHFFYGEELLESDYTYRGTLHPFAAMTGEEYIKNGVTHYKSFVHDLKAPARVSNAAKSYTADWLTRAMVPQWLVQAEHIADFQEFWTKGGLNGAAVLPYSATSNGEPPQRMDAPQPPAISASAAQESDADIRTIVGIRDASEQLPENVASETLRMHIAQSNIGTYGWHARLNGMVRYAVRVMVDLISNYYTEAEIRQIRTIDGQVNNIPINQEYQDNGQIVGHFLGRGKYNVTVVNSPDYKTRQSEIVDKFMEIAKVYPNILGIGGDILVRNIDFPAANELADRIKATIPPNIIAASNPTNGDGSNQVAQLQMQLQQMGQQMQQMQMQFQQMMQQNQMLQQREAAGVAKIQAQGQVDANLKNLGHQHELELLAIENQHDAQKTKYEEGQDLAQIDRKGNIDAGLIQLKSTLGNPAGPVHPFLGV